MVKRLLTNGVFHEFIKFGIVGVSGILVNLAVLLFFTEVVGFFYMISAIFAFLVALTTNFALNKTWTFKEKVRHKLKSRYVKYFLANLVALGINLAFLYMLTEYFNLYYILSQVLSIGIAFGFNFVLNKFWTFKEKTI